MAFQIQAHGPREGVIKKIKAAKPHQGSAEPDPQLEAMKEFLLSRVDLVPSEFNALRVTATGQVSASGGDVGQWVIVPEKHDV